MVSRQQEISKIAPTQAVLNILHDFGLWYILSSLVLEESLLELLLNLWSGKKET
jgi:hypothetical protein